MPNGSSEHADIFRRLNVLEKCTTKLETELPHITRALEENRTYVGAVVGDVKRWQIGTVTTIALAVLGYIITQLLSGG